MTKNNTTENNNNDASEDLDSIKKAFETGTQK